MALDFTAFDAALKVRYPNDVVNDLVSEAGGPLFDLMPRFEKATGKEWEVPLIWGDPQGVSADISKAISHAATSNGNVSAFTIALKKKYGVVSIDNMTLEASADKEGSFLPATEFQIDGILRQVGKSLGISLYGAGWGDIGIIGAIGSNIITLATKEDVRKFEKGQKLVFADSQSGDALRDSGTAATVTAVNRSEGKVTISATPSGTVAGDYIFIDGDRQNSGTPAKQVVDGLESWIPATAPTSTAFNGVDRSVDTDRLGGLRLDATSGGPIQEVLYEAAALVAAEGGKLTHFFMPYSQWVALEKSFDGKATVVTEKRAEAEIGYDAIVVRGPKGAVKCVADPFCPANRIFGLHMPSWKLYSLGKAVRIFDADGNKLLREATADAVQLRALSYSQLACNAPGWNINVQVTALT